MYSRSYLLATATISVCAAVAYIYYEDINDWYQHETVMQWIVLERRIRRAATTPIQDGLPRGWIRRRNLAGRTYYFNLISRQSLWTRPESEQLYQPLRRGNILSTKQPFDVRLACIVPSVDERSPLECILVTLPWTTFLRHQPGDEIVRRPISPSHVLLWLLRKIRPPWTPDAFQPPQVYATCIGHSLSYCWGDPAVAEFLHINGHRLGITENLARCLRQFRSSHASEVTMLWIDAICINQEDFAEKAVVVKEMSVFYQWSLAVHVYLGNPDSALLFIAHLTLEKSKQKDDLGVRERSGMEDGSISASVVARTLAVLKEISSLQYWTRRWVIQEACMARQLVVYCGKYRVSLDNAADLFWTLRRLESGLQNQKRVAAEEPERYSDYHKVFLQDDPTNMSKPARALFAGTQIWRDKQNQPEALRQALPQIMKDITESRTFEPKDAVFSILSLFGDLIKMKPDYTLHKHSIYAAFTAELLRMAGTLDLLRNARFLQPQPDSFATWFPDFSRPMLNDWLHFSHENVVHNASASTEPCFRILDDNTALISAGVSVGRVTTVCSTLYRMPGYQHAGERELLRQTLSLWIAFIAEHGHARHSNDIWRLLSFDCVRPERGQGPKGVRPNTSRLQSEQSEITAWLDGLGPRPFTVADNILIQYQLFATDTGYIGVTKAPAGIEVGDHIITLASYPLPLCAREVLSNALCDLCRTQCVQQAFCCVLCLMDTGCFGLCTACFAAGGRCPMKGGGEHPLLEVRLINGVAIAIRSLDGEWNDVPLEAGTNTSTLKLKLLGHCYVEGVMDGSAVRGEAQRRFNDEQKVQEVMENMFIT